MDTFVQQLINGLTIGAIYALIALGYTMVYGILRLINFAHGDVYMLGAFAGYYLANAFDLDAHPSVLMAVLVTMGSMAICAGIGVLIERLAYRPVRHHSRLTSLITAIGVSLLLEYGGQVVFGWLHGIVGSLPGQLDLYDAIRRPEARREPMSEAQRVAALIAGGLALPVSVTAALVEAAIRRGGTVYVEARRG